MAEGNEEAVEMELVKFLQSHSDKEFVRRILDPSLNVNPIRNEDGSISTHSMAAEVDENGNWFVFPTVVNEGGKLVRKPLRQAQQEAISSGQVIPFGKNKEQAINFSAGGYKTRAFRNLGKDRQQNSQFQDVFRQP